jgi:prefoldin subunit 5
MKRIFDDMGNDVTQTLQELIEQLEEKNNELAKMALELEQAKKDLKTASKRKKYSNVS